VLSVAGDVRTLSGVEALCEVAGKTLAGVAHPKHSLVAESVG
jgi:hypothetical protein